jgi:hypothetical protein
MQSKIKVIITQSRQGPSAGYKAGQEAELDPAKAAFAVAAGWARYADPQTAPAQPQKRVPPIAGHTAPTEAWKAVLATCNGDLAELKKLAKERKVKGWALIKDAEKLAKMIAAE